MMFLVYLVGAGTNDAARKKSKTLRRPPTTPPPTTPLPARNGNSANEWSAEHNHKIIQLDDIGHATPESAHGNSKKVSEVDNVSENTEYESSSEENDTNDIGADTNSEDRDKKEEEKKILNEQTNNSSEPNQEREKSEDTDISKTAPESPPDNTVNSDDEQKNLEASISEAIEDLSVAEEESMKENESILTDTFKHIQSTMRTGLSRIFANFQDFSTSEMDDIVKEVSDELELEVHSEFKGIADALTDAKADDIGQTAEFDQEVDYDVTTILEDVKQVEELSIQGLKKEIEQAARNMTKSMRKKAQKIEMEVIQKAMANKERKKNLRVKPIDTKDDVARESLADDQGATPEQFENSTDTSDVRQPDTKPDADKEKLEKSIKHAILEFDETEEDTIDAHESDLGEALKSIESMLKNSLDDLFGSDDDVSAAEIISIASEVSSNLERQVKSKFRKAADSLTLSKAIEIENIVEDDEATGVNTNGIVVDVIQVERTEVEKLKQEIDIAAEDVKKAMKKEAAQIEKDIIDKALAKRKRKKFHKFKIVNDEVEIDEGAINESQREEKDNGNEAKVEPSDSNSGQDKNEEEENPHEGKKKVSSSSSKSIEGHGEKKNDSRSKRDETEERSESDGKVKESANDGDKKDSSSKDTTNGAVDGDENESRSEDESTSQ